MQTTSWKSNAVKDSVILFIFVSHLICWQRKHCNPPAVHRMRLWSSLYSPTPAGPLRLSRFPIVQKTGFVCLCTAVVKFMSVFSPSRKPTVLRMSSSLQVFHCDNDTMTFCLHRGLVTGERAQITAGCLNRESIYPYTHTDTHTATHRHTWQWVFIV